MSLASAASGLARLPPNFAFKCLHAALARSEERPATSTVTVLDCSRSV